jgi:hypothetical protein
MARIIGGIGSSHVPTIGVAYDARTTIAEQYVGLPIEDG